MRRGLAFWLAMMLLLVHPVLGLAQGVTGSDTLRVTWGAERTARLGSVGGYYVDRMNVETGETGSGYGTPGADLRMSEEVDGLALSAPSILDLGAVGRSFAGTFAASGGAGWQQAVTAVAGRTYIVATGSGKYARVYVEAATPRPAGLTLLVAPEAGRASTGTPAASPPTPPAGSTPTVSTPGVTGPTPAPSASPATPARPAANACPPFVPPVIPTGVSYSATSSLQAVVRSGDALPGGRGLVGIPATPVVNSAGVVAFATTADTGGPEPEYALLTGVPGRLAEVARAGSTIPGGQGYFRPLPGDAIGPFRGAPRLNDRGSIAFLGAFDPDCRKTYASALGIFTTTQKVAVEGDPSPDFPNRRFFFDPERSNPPSLGNDDTMAFGATLSGDGYDQGANRDAGLYTGRPGALRGVAHWRGQVAAGTQDWEYGSLSAEDWLGFGPPGLGADGTLAFAARQKAVGQPAESPASWREVIYRLLGDRFTRVLASSAPELVDNRRATIGNFYDVKHAAAVNARGTVALAARVDQEEAVLTENNGPLQLVAQTGQPAPGGLTYSLLRWQPAINDRDQVAFAARLRGGTLSAAEAIYLGTAGNLQPIVRTGQKTPEDDGTFAELTRSDYYLFTADRLNLNNQGQLAFLAGVRREGAVRTDLGLYVYDGRNLRKVVRTGDVLEGKTVADIRFNSVTSPGVRGLNDACTIAFTTVYTGGSAALWVGNPCAGATAPVSGPGPAPGPVPGPTPAPGPTPGPTPRPAVGDPLGLTARIDGGAVILNWQQPVGPSPTPGTAGPGPTAGALKVAVRNAQDYALVDAAGQPVLVVSVSKSTSGVDNWMQNLVVAVGAPKTDVTVSAHQEGTSALETWRKDLEGRRVQDGVWSFILNQTSGSLPYFIRIASPALAAAGLGEAVTLQWLNDGGIVGTPDLPAAPATAAATPAATQFAIFRAEGSGAEPREPLTDFPVTGTTYRDNKVKAGGTYTYRVQAVTAGGTGGPASAVVSVTVPAGPVTPAVQPGRRTVRLTLDSTAATVDGAATPLDVAPQSVNGRTMVPLRFLGQALGANLVWDAREMSVTYTLGTKRMVLWIGRAEALVDGERKAMDVPPTIVDGRSLVPLRFISENLGAQVEYNAGNRSITISYASGGENANPTPTPVPGPGPAPQPAPAPQPEQRPEPPARPEPSGLDPAALLGEWSCRSARWDSPEGGYALDCKLVPRLTFQDGGSFTWGSAGGTYRLEGNRVRLGDMMGRIEAGDMWLEATRGTKTYTWRFFRR